MGENPEEAPIHIQDARSKCQSLVSQNRNRDRFRDENCVNVTNVCRVLVKGLEQSSLDNTGFVLSELTTLLLGPKLATDSFPAVPGRTGYAIMLTTAVAWTGRATWATIFVVDLVEIAHGVVAHRRRTRGSQGIAHARWTAGTAGIIGQCITSTGVARRNAGRQWRAGRGRLRVEP